MSFWQCCCPNPLEEERKPFARSQKNAKQVKVLTKGEKLVVKHVNVPELDRKFSVIAELYNDQVESQEILTYCASTLKVRGCASSLTECIQTLQETNSNSDIKVKMEGYNFSLLMTSKEELPENLREVQELVKRMSRATKLVISNQMKFTEMVFAILQKKTQMADEIKQVNTAYLDQIRLQENLQENVHNIEQAKQWSKEYAEEANNILREMAKVAGVHNI